MTRPVEPQTSPSRAPVEPASVTTTHFAYFCKTCGAPHERWGSLCEQCGGYNTIRHVANLASVATSDFADASPERSVHVPTGLEWFDKRLAGGLPVPCCWLLGGSPAGGKTSLATMLVAAWQAGPVVWVSTEQTRGEVVEYALRIGVERARPASSPLRIIGEEREITTARAVIRLADENGARLLVVDSLGGIEDADASRLFKRWALRARAACILIAPVNASGEVAGPTSKRHDVTLVGSMLRDGDKRTLHMAKSRHGAGTDGWSVELRMDERGRLAPP